MKRKICIPIVAFFILFSIGAFFVWADDIWETSLSITSGPSFYGPSGTYTKLTDENGVFTWSPSAPPTSVSIYLDASLYGGGDAQAVITSASVTGPNGEVIKSWSLPQTGSSRVGDKKISSWTDDYGSVSTSHFAENVPTDPGSYSWGASGYVETTTWELQRTVELAGPENIVGGYTTDWVVLHKDQTPVPDGAGGGWSIVEMYGCSKCSFRTEYSSELSDHACHLCNGGNDSFKTDPAQMTGHRALLCAVNHTYYECDPSAVYYHTTSVSCPVTGTQLLLCEVPGHTVRCSGCNNNYKPFNFALLDIHRARTCYYCNQQYRLCDTDQYCSYGPSFKHSGE